MSETHPTVKISLKYFHQINSVWQIFAQILLTFRYGRDDEEVMGLKLSNESVLCVEQVYPPLSATEQPTIQPSQCQVICIKTPRLSIKI